MSKLFIILSTATRNKEPLKSMEKRTMLYSGRKRKRTKEGGLFSILKSRIPDAPTPKQHSPREAAFGTSLSCLLSLPSGLVAPRSPTLIPTAGQAVPASDTTETYIPNPPTQKPSSPVAFSSGLPLICLSLKSI